MCEANNHRREEEEELGSEINNPIERLMRVIDLLNSIGSLMRNMEFEEDGLSEKELQGLKKFQYKPGK